MSIEHLQALREKYPQYADIPDQQLASKVVAKYPQYRDILGDVADLGVAGGRNVDTSIYPAPPPKPRGTTPSTPTFLDTLRKSSSAYRTTEQFAKGAGETVTGIPAFLSALMKMPGNVVSETKEMIANPREAVPRVAGEVGTALNQMIPYPETRSRIMSGQMPQEGEFSRESGQLAASALLPNLFTRAGKSIARRTVKELPGAGVELQSMAAEKADRLARGLDPGTQAVSDAYARRSAVGGNPTIDVSPVRSIADRIKSHETAASRPDSALASQMENILKGSETGWNMEYALSEYRRLGEQMREIKRTRGEVPAEMTELYQTMRSVIENPQGIKVVSPAQSARPASTILGSGGQPAIPAQPARPAVTQATPATPKMQSGASAWTEAQKLAHRQFSVEELIDRVNKAAGVSGEGYRSYSPNAVIKWIEQQEKAATLGHPDNKARLFVQGFQPGELATVKSQLRGMAQDMAALPTMRGTPVGSSQRVLLGSLGEVLGQTFGGIGHTGQGATAGILLGEGISRLMTTEAGRSLVRRAMQIDPSRGPAFWKHIFASGGLQYGTQQNKGNALLDTLKMTGGTQ